MAIKLRIGDNKFVYKATDGYLSHKSKKRADKIYAETATTFNQLKDKDADILEFWYLRGMTANSIIRRFSFTADEKTYFWQTLYDITGTKMPPAAIKSNTKRNDFLTASLIAQYKLSELRKVGTWSLWREVVGSVKVANDDRVSRWVIGHILRHSIATRDGARPLLKFVRNRLKNLDTSKLTKKELLQKLSEFDKK